MPQNSFPSDIFGFINGVFIIVLVIVIVFFIIVILIVYKLLHSNVDNVQKRSAKVLSIPVIENSNTSREEVKIEEIISMCKYCGENIEEGTLVCPYCGSDLAV